MFTIDMPETIHHAPIHTWFGVGGSADRLMHPRTAQEIVACVKNDPALRILGDGANLLVHDRGVRELVISLSEYNTIERSTTSDGERVWVAAGVNLPKFITAMVRDGLAGVEGLAGIPASIGGAVMMNAGGKYGEISDAIVSVDLLSRDGEVTTKQRDEIAFGYRQSGLQNYIVLGAELALQRSDGPALRERLKEVMEYKKKSQPMSANSAGCSFKNPTLLHDIDSIGTKGSRVSAGMLIDRAGCKGLVHGSASVSMVHGNFLTAAKGGLAADVIALMNQVTRRVHDQFGVTLVREVVVWGE